MERVVSCPSGMKGRIRGLKVKEESIWTDKKVNAEPSKLFTKICQTTWLETLDKGPYNFEEGGDQWGTILQGDAFYLFLVVIALTYGEDYEFGVSCNSCGKRIEESIDLLQDLRFQELPEKTAEHLSSGEPIEGAMSDGTSYYFKVLRLADEKSVTRIQQGRELNARASRTIARLVHVEGVGDRPLDIVKHCENMDARELENMREFMDSYDCGVDTEIPLACEHCFTEQVADLPLDPSLFSREKRNSSRRRKEKMAGELGSER